MKLLVFLIMILTVSCSSKNELSILNPTTEPIQNTNSITAGGEPSGPSIYLKKESIVTGVYVNNITVQIVDNDPSSYSKCTLRLMYICNGVAITKNKDCTGLNGVDFYTTIKFEEIQCSESIILSLRPTIFANGLPKENSTILYGVTFGSGDFILNHMPEKSGPVYLDSRSVTQEEF